MLTIAILADDVKLCSLDAKLVSQLSTESNIHLKSILVQKPINNSLRDRLCARGLVRIIAAFHHRLLYAAEQLLLNLFARQSREKINVSGLFTDVKIVSGYTTGSSHHLFEFTPESIAAIKQDKYDLIIRFSSYILKGDILNSSRLGILSEHNGDNRFYRGGPPGFWEVFHSEPYTGYIIQLLTKDLDAGKVIYRGWTKTRFFYAYNRYCSTIASHSATIRIIKNIASTGSIETIEQPLPFAGRIYKLPSTSVQQLYVLKTFSYVVRQAFRRALHLRYRWNVALSLTHWRDTSFSRAYPISFRADHFLADPFLLRKNESLYLLAEAYSYKKAKGLIVASKINREKCSKPLVFQTILEERHHLSFPFTFTYNSSQYLVPESHEARTISLYRFDSKSLALEEMPPIMSNVSAVDSLIFPYNNLWWLLTNIDINETGEFDSSLFCYYSDNPLSGDWRPHQLNPIVHAAGKARNGGLILEHERPIRVCQHHNFLRYGSAISLLEIIELTPTSYHERLITELTPNFKQSIEGIHHMSSIEDITAFDFAEYH